ncbi:hypothetical protein [Planobispora longispora]|uniref:Uncharacterized protein n=1 Tax=Planobispora longispora TaxID=28887 RepID=A0A8J3RQH6_9ACTN|nr:hypothetical protein [Planobispora longispora]GIH79927.1 hypothetical protein Plo01_63560 [Planobispora longispora]
MRFILDLYYTPDGGVHGRLTPPGSVTAQPFDGWLDLLRLLEPPGPAETGDRVEGRAP